MRWIDPIIKIITFVAICCLIGSYTAPYIDPNILSFPSLLGLAYHFLLIVNVVLMAYWIARWKKMAIISFVALLSGYPFMMTYYGMNPKDIPDDSYDLQLMSYNVRQLDIYGWSGRKNGNTQMIQYINHFKGQVVCLQEFPRQENSFKNFPDFPHTHNAKDLAILSKGRIINKGSIKFDKGDAAACIYCDIVIKTDTLRFYNVHLESYRFGEKDRQVFLEFPELKSEALSEGIRSIVSHIVTANKNRAKQAKTLKKHINDSPYRVILSGDFNDTPLSYTYTTLDRNMSDSFIEKGRGVGNTYIGEFPSFRIDHILLHPNLQAIAYFRDTITLSDHYPISAKIRLLKD